MISVNHYFRPHQTPKNTKNILRRNKQSIRIRFEVYFVWSYLLMYLRKEKFKLKKINKSNATYHTIILRISHKTDVTRSSSPWISHILLKKKKIQRLLDVATSTYRIFVQCLCGMYQWEWEWEWEREREREREINAMYNTLSPPPLTELKWQYP